MPSIIMEDHDLAAQKEIRGVLKYGHMCTRSIGLSFIEQPRNFKEKLLMNIRLIMDFALVTSLCCGEFYYMMSMEMTSGKAAVKQIVATLHLDIYAYSSLARFMILYYKRHAFKKLIIELVDIWPTDVNEEEGTIKKSSISAVLRLQFWYMLCTTFSVTFFCLTPIALDIYDRVRGIPTKPAFIWFVEYPFDKSDPVNNKIVVIFEILAGYMAVGNMLSSEFMFTAMASNISMLLRILQSKIKKLKFSPELQGHRTQSQSTANDGYDEIVHIIKIHQKLVSYSNDLEDAFSVVNLSNVLLSSIMICCCVFNIVLQDPWLEVSNKFFLGGQLSQIGIMCWYADDVYTSSMSVAEAVYECPWYEATPRCRRALLLMIIRSQRPLCFTAYKFSDITMTTYSSILTTSYSYFTLIYSMFQ